VVDLSGDTFSDDASPAYTIIHSVSLLLAVILRKPYAICSQTIGPFHTRLTRWLARFLIDRAEAVTMRGTLSWAHLKHEVGVKNKIHPVTDLAFLLDAPDVRHLRQCREQGGARSNRPVIGINPSRIISQWMFPGEHSASAKEDAYEELMARLVGYLVQEHHVALIPHITGPEEGLGVVQNPDDRESIRGIMARRDAKGDWEAYLGDDVNTIMTKRAECDLFSGCRYHSCIEAVTAGVPTIMLAYSTKGQDLGLKLDHCLLEVVDVRGKGVDRLSIELSEAISRMRSRLPTIDRPIQAMRMRNDAMKNIRVVREVIAGLHRDLLGDYSACFLGRATCMTTRAGGASGGVTTALLCQAISDGLVDRAVVSGGDSLHPVPVATDRLGVTESQGSVYVEHPTPPAYTATLCKDGDHRFAVVGLPCQIRALKALEAKSAVLREAIALHVGLFCSHSVERMGVVLLLEAMGVDPDEIESVRYRAKMPATGRTGLYVKTPTKEYFVPLSRYWSRYLNFLFIPRKCWACKDLTNEEADISLGDAWGIDDHCNVILPRTVIGEEILRIAMLANQVEAMPVPAKMVVDGQRFFLSLKKNGTGPSTSVYKMVRRLGDEVATRRSLHPLVKLWVKKVVLK
jgi:coenzyme F420-reducing hydrogenase beta subunit